MRTGGTSEKVKISGLTALEIIVIVFILIVLAAVLYPAFTGGRPYGGGLRTRCLSQVKQLALANLMYATDYDDRMPYRDRWMDDIYPYHKNMGIEHCPGLQDGRSPNPNLYGYAFDSRLSLFDSKKIADPARHPLVYDSINLARNASDPFLSLPKPPRMHGDRPGNPLAYLDGHARVLNVKP